MIDAGPGDTRPGSIRRSSGPRPGAPWGYVVKRGAVALEVLVQRERNAWERLQSMAAGLEPSPERIEIRDAVYHRGVLLEQGLTSEEAADRGIMEGCEFVGGWCMLQGVMMEVVLHVEMHLRREGPGWEQPEAFWKALEEMFEVLEEEL